MLFKSVFTFSKYRLLNLNVFFWRKKLTFRNGIVNVTYMKKCPNQGGTSGLLYFYALLRTCPYFVLLRTFVLLCTWDVQKSTCSLLGPDAVSEGQFLGLFYSTKAFRCDGWFFLDNKSYLKQQNAISWTVWNTSGSQL